MLVKQSGFSLVSIMIALAIGSVGIYVSMEIVRSINTTLNFANASNEVNNQLYEARVALTDPATCLKNFIGAGVNLSQGTFALSQPLRPILPTGELNMQARLFPDQDGSPGLKAYAISQKLIRHPTIANLVNLSVEFESRSFATKTVLRPIPLYVTTDAGGAITACTAGSPNLVTASTPGGGSRGKACDYDDALQLMGEGQISLISQARKIFCENLQYPTPETGGRISCGLKAYVGNVSVLSFAPVNLKNNKECATRGPAGDAVLYEYGGLASKADCDALPLFPEGSSITGIGNANGNNTGKYMCLSGVWRQTSPEIVDPATLGGSGGE